ncbi:unnamed protein product, partial [Tetraodon nigroviridis]
LGDKAAFHLAEVSAPHIKPSVVPQPEANTRTPLTPSNEHQATQAESGEKGLVASRLKLELVNKGDKHNRKFNL